jgi:hypothetical protein
VQFAERELDLRRPDGTSQPVRVRLFTPQDRHEHGWVADIEIHGPGDEMNRSHGSSVDAFQALETALRLIPVMLGKLSLLGDLYLGDEPGHHFPSIRVLPEHLDVIAERTIAFRPTRGRARRVPVYLGRPYQHGPRDVWFVRVSVLDEEKP